MNICLLNDSFPPLIDGVSNTIKNYAGVLNQNELDKAVVVTPDYPKANDSLFNYPIYRYPSIDFTSVSGYYAGAPFSPYVNKKLDEFGTEIMHSHCPFASTLLARAMKDSLNVPVVLTYHTKFDIEIKKALSAKMIQNQVISAVVNNISSCDEVWVVSEGAGKNLQSLGYQGDYVVMENGVDVPKGRMDVNKYMAITRQRNLHLPNDVPVFLFVGRIYWYKGLRIILDALSALAGGGLDFRMVFIGGGREFDEVKAYSESLGLDKKVFFTGPIYDREELTAWYNRAD
ncbi:MAG: glycosyltransferase, partial [Clostridia bacterium]|nr:glycosyltransferase [Clostridia bacterium]